MKKKTHHHHHYSTGLPALDQMIRKLLEQAGGSAIYDRLLEDIIITAVKLKSDEIDRGDVRLLTIALKELRYAFKIFHPYKHVRKIAIFGSARIPPEDKAYKQAKDFAKKIVDKGWMVITGAASGIMSAGNEGAGRENSFGVNIKLPFEQAANETILDDQKLIDFKYFFTRKLIFMSESDSTALFPGGFGTHDEGFETLTLVQTGKTTPRPIVCIDPPGSKYWSMWKRYLETELAAKKLIDREDMKLIFFTHNVDEAADFVARFYRNYHSCRYVGDNFVMRLKHPISKLRLQKINRDFKDLLKKGSITQVTHPFPEEDDEPHTHDLTRLVFNFNRRHFSRLNTLIHAINQD
ncbi:MAG: LOG family protein [Candidatus Omnitrophica bacterium]|nr:LOG family protein [Candidatus Omnitrophota bacterium]